MYVYMYMYIVYTPMSPLALFKKTPRIHYTRKYIKRAHVHVYVYNIPFGQLPSAASSIPVAHLQVCLLATYGLGRQR